MNRLAFLVIATIFSCGMFIITSTRQAQTPPGMVLIPGGEFEMGDHYGVGEIWELPVHAVYIDSFYMDIYEVTNQQYCDYLNSAFDQDLIEMIDGVVYKADNGTNYPYCSTTSAPIAYPHYGEYSRITWNDSTFGVASGKEDHPMVVVSWYGAVAYANWRGEEEGRPPCYDLDTWECDFDPVKARVWLDEATGEAKIQEEGNHVRGYRLPTEAEWEYATRGIVLSGGQNPDFQDHYYKYPWGNDIDGSKANYSWSGDPYETGGHPWTTPVGFYNGELHHKDDFGWPGSAEEFQTSNAENGYGLYDMAGNLWEWCNDWYSSTYYSSSPYDNPHGPASGTFRVCRSGSWYSDENNLRCAVRSWGSPDWRNFCSGFRLVLPAE